MGQLSFGYIGDCLGRGPALQLTMILSILGAIVSAFAVPLNSSDQSSVFTFLTITRFVLGLGVGGVYPLAATISAESARNERRGRNVSLVFSMQGIGTLLVPVLGTIILKLSGAPDQRAEKVMPNISWRLILGLGALPGVLLMPFRTNQVAPSPSDQESNRNGADAQNAPLTNDATPPLTLLQALSTPTYWGQLLGCAGGWFVFDITFYGNTLFAPTVLRELFHSVTDTTSNALVVNGSTLKTNLCWQLIILGLIGLPGYYISVCFMDKIGRKTVQLQGFIFMALTYGVLGIWLKELQHHPAPLLIFYGLTYFFSNFGPNSTTFILPSETFPYEVRTTLNGFSAAMGKVGATVGTACFKPMTAAFGAEVVFLLCAGCAIVGVLLTIFFVEDKRGQDMASSARDFPVAQDVSLQNKA